MSSVSMLQSGGFQVEMKQTVLRGLNGWKRNYSRAAFQRFVAGFSITGVLHPAIAVTHVCPAV